MSPKFNLLAGSVLVLTFLGAGIAFLSRTGSPFDAVNKRNDLIRHDYVADLLRQALSEHKRKGKFPERLGLNPYDHIEVKKSVKYRKLSDHAFELTTTYTYSSEYLRAWSGNSEFAIPFKSGKNTFRFDKDTPMPMYTSREW